MSGPKNLTWRQRLARRLDPELAETEWLDEFCKEQMEEWHRGEPIASLYREDVHLGFAPHVRANYLLISEVDDLQLVHSMDDDLSMPSVGSRRVSVFRQTHEKIDHLYQLPRFDFWETR